MPYEIITLSCAPLQERAVAKSARDWSDQGTGKLLGVWRTEIGDLFQVKILRRFDTMEAFQAERHRALMSKAPFDIDDPHIGIDMACYARFPFLPEVESGQFGQCYEFRTYFLKPGGLTPTLQSWERAIAPAHDYTRHLVVNLYALDGPPRITHIWGFSSLEERAALRADHYAKGVWPPQGAPHYIATATSTICIPESYSPLR